MASLPLHASSSMRLQRDTVNTLPQLLRTPSGLALLELQGTINLPDTNEEDGTSHTDATNNVMLQQTSIGRLVFPLYEDGIDGTEWMKRVHLYVGKHQRLTGEVRKLPKAIAIIRKRTDELPRQDFGGDQEMQGGKETNEELEIVEIVKYKILFSSRPEPVGTLPDDETS